MIVDEIPEPYKAFMRWWDGSISEVQWFFTDPDAPVLELPTPFRSGHQTPDWPFDMGCVGEIPERFIRRSTITKPNWVVACCHVGDDIWWDMGWPDGTPGVVLLDGFAIGCEGLMPVTSVGLDMPGEFDVANSPITGSGTFVVTKVPQDPHLFYAGPMVGVTPEEPVFRAIVADDLAAGPDPAKVLYGDMTWGALPPIPPSTVVDGVSPITVSFDGFWTYTVSLTGTIPTSQITGTLPSAQLGTGYPFSDLAGSATPAQLPTLDTIAGATGKLSAGNLLSGYPFSDLAGSALPAQLPTFGGSGLPGIVPDPTGSPAGSYLDKTGAFTVPPSGTGTVTSVALTMPAEFSVGGSPITGSGTLAVTKATQTANRVYAGPTTGAAAAPTFRLLVAADIPSLDASIITSGTLAASTMPSTVTQSVQFDVDFSQFGSTSGNTKDANIGAIPAGYAVRGAYIRCTTNATNTVGTWGNWQLSTSLGAGDIGTFTAQTAATTSFSQNITGPNRGSQGATNCWMRIVLGGNGTLTGGHWKVTLVCDPVA